VDLRLRFPVTVANMKSVGVRPTRGDFGLPEACLIKPGDPWASTLYFRMAKFGRDRMPHIGSDRPDEAGLKLIEDWIAGMSDGKKDPVSETGPPDKLLASARSALFAARKVGRREMNPAERDRLLAAAAQLPPGPVRDLFEGYLPPDPKGERKLGSSPRPRTILALSGDAGRGETLFWSAALNCGSCHKIGDRGTPLGPDLSTIGKLRGREDLLESILEPSRRIEPKYASYVANAADGRLIAGLLVRRNEKEVVLRDAQNNEIIVPATQVEELRPSLTSIMPNGQMAGLTAQDAADLLQYLATRK
jgi:putative heme-binding domain-containing protein